MLNLALKFLNSNFLEKRIKGMNEINQNVSDEINDDFSHFRQ
jgi:hypothetical protein